MQIKALLSLGCPIFQNSHKRKCPSIFWEMQQGKTKQTPDLQMASTGRTCPKVGVDQLHTLIQEIPWNYPRCSLLSHTRSNGMFHCSRQSNSNSQTYQEPVTVTLLQNQKKKERKKERKEDSQASSAGALLRESSHTPAQLCTGHLDLPSGQESNAKWVCLLDEPLRPKGKGKAWPRLTETSRRRLDFKRHTTRAKKDKTVLMG